MRGWVESFHAPRWAYVCVFLVLVGVPGLLILNTLLYSRSEHQKNTLALVKQRQMDDERLIAAQRRYIEAQQSAKKAAAVVDAKNRAARCQGAINGTKAANTIIEGLKETLLELADVSVNPAGQKKLRERAATFHLFPKPDCDPVYHAPGAKPKGGH
jgi:hypothetical protein